MWRGYPGGLPDFKEKSVAKVSDRGPISLIFQPIEQQLVSKSSKSVLAPSLSCVDSSSPTGC
jgi:hypothetical protein